MIQISPFPLHPIHISTATDKTHRNNNSHASRNDEKSEEAGAKRSQRFDGASLDFFGSVESEEREL